VVAKGRLPFELSLALNANEDKRVGAVLLVDNLEESASNMGLIGGVLLGSGGGVAVVATALWIFAANKAAEAREATLDDLAWEKAANAAQALEAGAWVSAVSALGLIASGSALLIIASGDKDDSESTTWVPMITPTAGGVGFGAAVRF